MSKGKNQKSDKIDVSTHADLANGTPKFVSGEPAGTFSEFIAEVAAPVSLALDINLVIETLSSLPSLRRYGKEEEAIEEAKAAMLRIKERALR